MKTQFSKAGIITLTAETKRENEMLFKLINGESVTTVVQKERSDKGGTHIVRKQKVRYSKECPVEGCTHRAKTVGLHMRMMHGVDKSGKVHQTFTHCTKGLTPVSQPVVENNDGTFRLKSYNFASKPSKKVGLLDDEPSFTRGGIIV